MLPVAPVGRRPDPYLLIADDELGVLEVTRAMASAIGWHALLANNAEHALSLFSDHASEIDHVLVDLHMPGAGGGTLAEELRRIRPDVNLYVMTGDEARASELIEGCELADGVLLKPFVLDQLEQALERRPRAA